MKIRFRKVSSGKAYFLAECQMFGVSSEILLTWLQAIKSLNYSQLCDNLNNTVKIYVKPNQLKWSCAKGVDLCDKILKLHYMKIFMSEENVF